VDDGQETNRPTPKGMPNTEQEICGPKIPLADSLEETGSGRILVVDDEKEIRDILLKALSVLGLEVIAASSGTEGLDLFLKGSFDLVLTDLRMPGMDGLDLAFHIKERSPNTQVVLITGQQKEEVMERNMWDCVDLVMFKPFRLKEMGKTVHRMLVTGSSKRRA